jgi:peptide deformylase
MSILKVARMGHPVLRQKARAVEKHELRSPAMQQFIDNMFETMREYSGVGLAAPQVHASLRVFVAHLDSDGRGESEPIAIVNPEIEIVGDAIIESWEGCLSIPDIRGRVPRSLEITLNALDRQGRGILFLDRMRSFESLTYMDEFSRFHSKKNDDEEDDDE